MDGRRRARKGRVVARVEAARAAVVAARARPWPTARVASTREAHPRALQRSGAAPAAAVDGDEDGASRERRGSTRGAPVVLGGGVGGLGAQELQIRRELRKRAYALPADAREGEEAGVDGPVVGLRDVRVVRGVERARARCT